SPPFIEAISKLLWPVATVIIALLFRTQIRDLLRRVKKAVVLGNEVSFEDVQKLEAQTHELIEKSRRSTASRHRSSSKDDTTEISGGDRADLLEPERLVQRVGLLSRPIDGASIKALRRRIAEDTQTATILLRAELERAMREVLASYGKI